MDNNVYNYLLASYSPKSVSKYDAHKNSELRRVINKIHKISQDSPVYLIELNDKKQSYALDIKESSMTLGNVFMNFRDATGDGVFNKRQVVSSDEEQVYASMDEEIVKDDNRKPIKFKAAQMATAQVNTGKEFYKTGKGLSGGTHYFSVSVNSDTYDFQFNTRQDANHEEVMNGLSSFINKANIGVSASVINTAKDKIQMQISSDYTGTTAAGNMFSFSDKQGGLKKGIVSFYNLDNITTYPENAEFELNGAKRISQSNTFTVGKSLTLTINGVSDNAATISYEPDSSSIVSKAEDMANVYNRLINAGLKYDDGTDKQNGKRLKNEFTRIFEPYKSELEANGISFDDSGRMALDESLLTQSANDGSLEKLFGSQSKLAESVIDKANEIKLDPMNYVDKTLVSYPDYSKPTKGLSYITSMYSGMLFNYYC